MRAVMIIGSTHADAFVRVTYSSEYAEYRARLYRKGNAVKDADYFTDDRDDAVGTAALMLQEEQSRAQRQELINKQLH